MLKYLLASILAICVVGCGDNTACHSESIPHVYDGAFINGIAPGGIYSWAYAQLKPSDTNKAVTITGAEHSANNGTFNIDEVLTPDSIRASNSNTVGEGVGATALIINCD